MKVFKDIMEEDIGSSLLVFELLGLQCFSLKHLTSENLNQRPTILRTIYMFVLCCCILVLTACYVSHDRMFLMENRTPKDILVFIISNSMNVGLILVVLTSFIQTYTSTKTIKRMFLNTKEITRICFNEFIVVCDFKKSKEAAWKRILKGVIFLAVLHVAMTLSQIKTSESNIVMAFAIVPTSYLLMIVFKYVFYVGIVNQQLLVLQKFLEKLFDAQVKIVENVNICAISSAIDPYRKLRAAWKIYNIIYENGAMINESQGLTVLVILASLIVALSVSGYQVFVITVGGMQANQIPGKILSK